MKDYHKKEIENLSKKLNNFVLKYMAEKFPNGDDTSDLINFVLSSHLSSAFTLMLLLSSEHKEMEKLVIKFIDDLKNAIKNIHPITKMETL